MFIFKPGWRQMDALSGKIQGVHVEDDGDVLGQRGFCQNLLHVVGPRAGAVGTQGDLETELAVRADQR